MLSTQLRAAGAPLALAVLNGTVLALMIWLQVSNVASQMRRFCVRPDEAVALLLGPFQREHGTLKMPWDWEDEGCGGCRLVGE